MSVGPGHDFPLKGPLLGVLRTAFLLPLAERFYRWFKVREVSAENLTYRQAHPDEPLPPPGLIQRTYGNASYRMFRAWGRRNADEVRVLIDQYAPCDDPKVLEWGCGLGRIAAHLSGDYNYTGVDIDPSSIGWCTAHLDGHYTVNTPSPPLPFADNSWDVVFAVSIFTHLSRKAHDAWRDEIHRVLKPGGVFLFTVHGAREAENLSGEARKRFDGGQLVTLGGVAEGSRTYLAYHPEGFVEDHLTAPFEALAGPQPCCNQTLYVRRKSLGDQE